MDKPVLVMDLAHHLRKGWGRGCCSSCAMPVSLSVGVLWQFSRTLLWDIAKQRQVWWRMGSGVPEGKRGGEKKTFLIQFKFSARYVFSYYSQDSLQRHPGWSYIHSGAFPSTQKYTSIVYHFSCDVRNIHGRSPLIKGEGAGSGQLGCEGHEASKLR